MWTARYSGIRVEHSTPALQRILFAVMVRSAYWITVIKSSWASLEGVDVAYYASNVFSPPAGVLMYAVSEYAGPAPPLFRPPGGCCAANPYFCSGHASRTLQYQHLYLHMVRHAIARRLSAQHDWLVVADDDTWVNVDRLLFMLSSVSPARAVHVAEYVFGKKNATHEAVTFCGGAGHVLSRRAATRLRMRACISGMDFQCKQSDWMLADCFQQVDVERVSQFSCGSCGSSSTSSTRESIARGMCFLAQKTEAGPYPRNTLAFTHGIGFARQCGGSAPANSTIDLLIPGPMKTGTTSWSALLKKNRYAVSTTSKYGKESHYFDAKCNRTGGVDQFLKSFPPGKRRLEVTPNYFSTLHTLLYSNIRFQRVLITLRNPTDRLYSVYRHALDPNAAWASSLFPPNSSFRAMWALFAGGSPSTSLRTLVGDGVYAPYVRGWRAAFGERLYLVDFHRMQNGSYARNVFVALGLDPRSTWPAINTWSNHTTHSAPIECDTMRKVRGYYKNSLSTLCNDEPKLCGLSSVSIPCSAHL